MHWISVKDKLPEKWQQIIIYVPEFNGSKDFQCTVIYCHKDSLQKATHWMPLPPAPELKTDIRWTNRDVNGLIAREVFKAIDRAIIDMKSENIDADFVERITINGKEFQRKDCALDQRQ